nr:MAG TPA: hypothetical protein [Caudoviricetes sp.]DAP81078.1 MAG TPA: hypothetical protein [Caudoviricetes sp.]
MNKKNRSCAPTKVCNFYNKSEMSASTIPLCIVTYFLLKVNFEERKS